MADITAAMVKELRERTGAGMADCKKALVETSGDMEKATEYLRKKGLAAAAKKAGRVATEGTVASYIHGGGRIGVLLEVNCETDFVARGDDFQGFVREASLQIAAMSPQFLASEDIPADVVAKERAILTEKAKEQGKPEAVLAKIVDGQISKWVKEICLLEQTWVKDDKKAIKDLLQDLIAKVGENCKIRRFVRFELGEGLEKKQDDFAAEVAKQAGLS
ncbi:MAG: translation elongation factor Ts [Deltaproteobacteria bacterium]|nr:translation elongation factor Ts [Deltaproteobacteria bacterium]